MSVKMPGKRKFAAVDVGMLSHTAPPVITNPAAVEKHTKLMVLDDMDLHKLTHKLHTQRQAVKAATECEGGARKRATAPAT